MAAGNELLTVAQIKALKKPGHYRDGKGLYLQVSVWGTKSWVFKYTVPTFEVLSDEDLAAGRRPKRIPGKLRSMGLGSVFDYTAKNVEDIADIGSVTLADLIAKPTDLRLDEVRKLARVLRDMVKSGIDPIDHRAELELKKQRAAKAEIEAARLAEEAKALEKARRLSFSQAVEVYMTSGRIRNLKNEKHRRQWGSTLQTYAEPIIGNMRVEEIQRGDIIRILEPIWANKPETANRLRGRIESVLNSEKVLELRSGENPASLKVLKSWIDEQGDVKKSDNHPALAVDDLPTWFADLKKREGMAARALELAVLCANRSAEIRGMTFDEITDLDGDNPMWVIPAARLKVKKRRDGKPVPPHRIPLSPDAVALLKTVAKMPRPENTPYVFPAARGGQLSDMALSAVMRRMHDAKVQEDGKGWLDPRSGRPAVPHGTCRATFRSWAAMRGYEHALAEIALAHEVGDEVTRAYQRSDMVERRRSMMAHYATACRGDDAGGVVVPFMSGAA